MMMTPADTWVYHLGTWFANIALILAIGFVLSYALFFKWWTRPAGRSIMAFVSMVVALSMLSLFSRLFGIDTIEYQITRLVTYLFALIASAGLLWTLWATWVKQPPDGLEPSNALTGEPTPRAIRHMKEVEDHDSE